MMLEYKNIGLVDADSIIAELQDWQKELEDNLVDGIVYETLDTVIDIIVNEGI